MPTGEDRLSPESGGVESESPGSPGRVEEVEKDGENWHPRGQVPRYARVFVLPEGMAEGQLDMGGGRGTVVFWWN